MKQSTMRVLCGAVHFETHFLVQRLPTVQLYTAGFRALFSNRAMAE
jgi:hypothetical protein